MIAKFWNGYNFQKKNGFMRKGSKKSETFSTFKKKSSQNGYGNYWPFEEECLKK
jgi:hypothetical protein